MNFKSLKMLATFAIIAVAGILTQATSETTRNLAIFILVAAFTQIGIYAAEKKKSK